ncbi:IclR family transcriptional regulator [Haloplanus pelagicus]|jgi:DNA-binding IclR family transcriptional regulator|uniref:IclR family transcriptional regulator n=1 Tax=Haloplanus pelagicus TaxID=2949995 RepID=UPI00203A8D05|nr:IclR family transcriptional regulator [Haloplanus sp. HW8-1]
MKSLDKSIKILDALVRSDGARVSELSDVLGMPNSTVHAHLSALKQHGLVRTDGDLNKIGLKFLHYSGSVRYDDEVFSLIEPKVTFLARETEERSQFIVEQDGQGVYLFTETIGDAAVQTDVRPGKFVGLHATAAGKAILAHLPDGRVDEIISQHGLTAYTPRTITERDALFEELSTIRDRGYAINDEERIMKQRAVGVPVLNPAGDPLGAFSVSGPAHRVDSDRLHETVSGLLLGTAEEVELNIQYR